MTVKKNITYGLIALAILTTIATLSGLNTANKLNNKSSLALAQIYEVTGKYYNFHFVVKNKMYEGALRIGRNYKFNLGDTLIIQYYNDDPIYHAFHSRKSGIDIANLELKHYNFWDVW